MDVARETKRNVWSDSLVSQRVAHAQREIDGYSDLKIPHINSLLVGNSFKFPRRDSAIKILIYNK